MISDTIVTVAYPVSELTTSTHSGSSATALPFTPHKQHAVADAIDHFCEANTASLVCPFNQLQSHNSLFPVTFVQVPSTPEKARHLLETPLDPMASHEEIVKENHELRAQLEGMRCVLDGARRIVEGSNATVALTQLGYSEMSRKLNWKKKNNSVKNRLLSTKIGRYITSDQFREAVAAESKARKLKEMVKAGRGKRRRLRKEAIAWRKSATERKKWRRERDLAIWERAKADAQR